MQAIQRNDEGRGGEEVGLRSEVRSAGGSRGQADGEVADGRP